jgi:hypothetical protein
MAQHCAESCLKFKLKSKAPNSKEGHSVHTSVFILLGEVKRLPAAARQSLERRDENTNSP